MKKRAAIACVCSLCTLTFCLFQNFDSNQPSTARGLTSCSSGHLNDSSEGPATNIYYDNFDAPGTGPMGSLGIGVIVNGWSNNSPAYFGTDTDPNFIYLPKMNVFAWVDEYCQAYEDESFHPNPKYNWALLYVFYPSGAKWEYWINGKVNY